MELRKNPNLETFAQLATRLNKVLAELKVQPEVGSRYHSKELSYVDEMKQLDEFINHADEYEIAYGGLVATIQGHGFALSPEASASLSEAALLLPTILRRSRD
jgi:hypothetical protein